MLAPLKGKGQYPEAEDAQLDMLEASVDTEYSELGVIVPIEVTGEGMAGANVVEKVVKRFGSA